MTEPKGKRPRARCRDQIPFFSQNDGSPDSSAGSLAGALVPARYDRACGRHGRESTTIFAALAILLLPFGCS